MANFWRVIYNAWRMKITKYPQSCLVIEKGGQSIVIDPGSLVTDKYKISDLGLIEAVLYTHQHSDHFDPAILAKLVEKKVEIYANSDVAAQGGEGITVIKDQEEFVTAGFTITAYDLPHCKMKDGSEGPPNTGFLIDGVFFHPGDGIELDGLRANGMALPIAGPSIDFQNALAFADQIEARHIIPIHYEVFKADPGEFAKLAGEHRVIVLENGQTTSLP